ncbi:glycerol kinase GlpK [Vulgatibacter incomptus]|uniref:Glycerol kinase n=1 Tax=Vulgatibacter incomptus TaxID=1391653 RepID=A0A0K1PFL0_9BACT|nr:glycerol kinase GlpK [Vulgatibacter incomptus]AKU92292.1 Glycerol kinase [Vulgatibacter incomptus]
MAKDCILAIDQGTTATTVLVLDESLEVKARASREFPQYFPKPGQVEHDLDEIWESVRRAIRDALRKGGIHASRIAAIGITNQRETSALWDRKSGAPVSRAIVWQDRRTADRCRELRGAGHEEMVRRKTGLVLDPYFSATKVEWMLAKVKGARARAKRGELAFGTIDSFLVNRLTAGEVHVTDATNASRTLLMDLSTLDWDEELLELFGVPAAVLPEIRASSEIVGLTKGVKVLPDGIPIAGIAGDQQAALFGQMCFDVGDSKCTYGTGAFLLMNVGDRPVVSREGLLTSVAWKLGGGETAFALEGSSFVAGAAVQWVRDGLCMIRKAADIEPLAASVSDSGGVVFVPALAGLGAPYWRPEARGILTGIHRGTTKAHIARAVLEGIALEIRDLADAMERDAERKIETFAVDGGACANDLLLQLQADLLGRPVVRPKMVETTALGAALLAGLAIGIWRSKRSIRRVWKTDRRFSPKMRASDRAGLLERWRTAVAKA